MVRILAAIVAASAVQAFASGYPSRPVHVIITLTPGSSTDIVGRIVAQKLSEYWDQPVVVENRLGAGGSIGSAAVAKAPPDGYTLLVNSNAHSVNPAIYAKLPYDTLQDFVDIAPLTMQPNGLWAPAGTPADVVAKISADTHKALADPAVREKLSSLGNEIMAMPPEGFARFVRDEIHEYAEVIR